MADQSQSRRKKVAKALVENVKKAKAGEKTKAVTKVLVDAGYSESYATKRQKAILTSKKMSDLLEHFLPRGEVMHVHKKLLNAHRIEHMVFPTSVPQEEIEDLLLSVNCVPKKFMFLDQATHVWYFAADNLAQDRALDKAYKLRGDYAAEKIQVEDPLRQMSDEELMAEIKKQTQALGRGKR